MPIDGGGRRRLIRAFGTGFFLVGYPGRGGSWMERVNDASNQASKQAIADRPWESLDERSSARPFVLRKYVSAHTIHTCGFCVSRIAADGRLDAYFAILSSSSCRSPCKAMLSLLSYEMFPSEPRPLRCTHCLVIEHPVLRKFHIPWTLGI